MRPSGRVEWSRKVRFDSSCRMNFTNLPYDQQNCLLSVGLYASDKRYVNLTWISGASVEPVQSWSTSITKPEWKILDAIPYDETEFFQGRNWSYVRVRLILKRNSEYYEQYVIAPTILFVVIAWSSFFIARAAAPARVAMSIILFLVINGQVNGQLATLPRGESGVWLLDFMSMSQRFVFYAILEYGMCNFLMRIEMRIEKAKVAAIKCRADEKPEGEATADIELTSTASKKATAISVTSVRVEARRNIFIRTLRKVDEPGGAQSLQAEIARTASSVTQVFPFLVSSEGGLRFRDQHLDIWSRWLFPLAYIIVLIVFNTSK